MAIRAITFDAAGTLIHVARPVGETYARAFRRHGLAVDTAEVERRFRAAFAVASPLAFPGCEDEVRRRAERDWWGEIVRHAAGGVNPSLDRIVDELFDEYASASAWRLDAKAPALLAELEQRGLRLGVVSNFDSRLSGILEGLGLARFFSVVVASAAAGAAKPEPEIFLAALHALGVTAHEALHVGDDETLDVAGARAAGMQALLLDESRPSGPTTIRRLTELLDRI